MTVSSSTRRTTTRLLAGLAVVGASLTACADVGDGNITVDTPPTGPAVICQSIRTAIMADKAAAEAAKAAGNVEVAKRKNEAVIAGAQGARTVENCNVDDLVPASGVPVLPTSDATEPAVATLNPAPSGTP